MCSRNNSLWYVKYLKLEKNFLLPFYFFPFFRILRNTYFNIQNIYHTLVLYEIKKCCTKSYCMREKLGKKKLHFRFKKLEHLINTKILFDEKIHSLSIAVYPISCCFFSCCNWSTGGIKQTFSPRCFMSIRKMLKTFNIFFPLLCGKQSFSFLSQNIYVSIEKLLSHSLDRVVDWTVRRRCEGKN